MPNEKEPLHKSKNIKFCAFLKLQGINPVNVVKITRGKGEFHYYMEQSRWDQFKINFNGSPYSDYAHCMESLKDLCY